MRMPTFILFRVTAAVITVLLLLLAGLGAAGRGPLDGLGTVYSHAVNWLRAIPGEGTQ